MSLFYLTANAVKYALYFVIPLWLLYRSVASLWHPLRSYPGPWLARWTDAYTGYFAYRKTLHHNTLQNFKKYGDVVRVGPNKLIFNSATAVQDIYLNSRVAKGEPFNHCSFVSDGPNLLTLTDRDDHRKKRKVVGAVISERSMRIFLPQIVGRINIFLKNILSSTSNATISPVNASHVFSYLGNDIIGDISFGQPFNLQTEETNRFMPRVFEDWAWRVNIMMQYPLLWWYNILVLFTVRLREANKTVKSTERIIRTREAMGKDARYDFYSVTSNELELGESFKSSVMWPFATNFIIAGATTTAAAMSSTVFYLSRYPECYSRLATEIRTTFSSAEEITQGPKLSGCVYLRACIEESMRCSPTISTILWRQLDPKDDSGKPFVVDGHVIEKGTQVGVNLYSLFHNEDIFPDPWTFEPERWLELKKEEKETPEEKEKRAVMRRTLISFGLGDRNCPGRALAWLEMSVAIARLFWYFEFENAPGEAGKLGEVLHPKKDGNGFYVEYKTLDAFAVIHDGPNLVFRPREGGYIKELK